MGRPKARKPRRPRAQSRQPESWAVFDRDEELVYAQSVRRRCDACGSEHLHWGDVAGGVFTAPEDSQRAAFTEAVSSGMRSDFVAWWCMDCDNLGIFGAPERL